MAKGIVGTYIPSQLTIVISHSATNTSFVLGGFGSDTNISIERPTATWTSTIGTHGDHQRTHSLDKTLNATVHLLQVSEYNDFMSALLDYDERSLRGEGLFTCTITDKSGRSYAYSDQAYVTQPSTYDYGSQASTRDWILVLPYAEQHIGGNAPVSQEHADILANLGINIDDSWIKN